MRAAIQTTLMCAGLLMAACGYVHAGLVTVTGTGVAVRVQPDFSSPSVDDLYSGTAIDGVDHFISASDGVNSNDGSINFSESATQTVFDMSFTQVRSGTLGAFTYSFGGFIFTANEAGLSYSLEGAYGSSDGLTEIAVVLYDKTSGGFSIFDSAQTTWTGGDSFVLGGTDGDAFTLTGNQNGSLIVGNQYQLYISMLSQAWLSADSGADADGFVRLTVSRGAVEEVPEPASLSLFGLGTLGLGFMARRRRAMVTLTV